MAFTIFFILLFLSVASFVFSFCMDGDAGDAVAILAGIMAGLGLVGMLFTNSDGGSRHKDALRQLQKDGWNITSKNIHSDSDKIDIGCLTFGLHKIEGRYRVTLNRPVEKGGGLVLLTHDDQTAINFICQELNHVRG